MKRYDPRRADARPIEEKAFALLYAMTDAEAALLHDKLGEQARLKSKRARLFHGIAVSNPETEGALR